jgi:2-polyprenyl-3-methyl-5-hydroxy-6-metoxy-1,4-benzoquinol methylase
MLRPLTHYRNTKTEEELNSICAEQTVPSPNTGIFRLEKLMSRLEGHFPVSDTLRYLDIGCGTGEIAIALASKGCEEVTGIDLVPRRIAQATMTAERLGIDNCVHFVCEDIHTWQAPCRYDVILSHEALEHIGNPQYFLKRPSFASGVNGFDQLT